MTNLNQQIINPAYVQIGKKEAAGILGFSVAELDRRPSSPIYHRASCIGTTRTSLRWALPVGTGPGYPSPDTPWLLVRGYAALSPQAASA